MISRRAFLKGVLSSGAAGLALEGFWFGRERLTIEDKTIWIRDLPLKFNDFTICQITDVHHGPFVWLDYVREVVERANALKPDIFALTGDYVSGDGRHKKYIEPVIDALSRLEAGYGRLAVLGNHDHWVDADHTRAAFRRYGIPLLRNSHTFIEKGGEKLCIAGVGDLTEDIPDAAEALRGIDRNTPRIVLSHNPDYAEILPHRERVDLVISGHTHGGQVRLPFSTYAPYLPSNYGQRYSGGHVKLGHTQVYVSRGLGVVGLPVRFNCPPEITVIRLKPDEM